MQTAFKREEMISATAAAKNFGKVVAELAEHKKDKAAVVRNNELTAVILSADVVEFVEHLELYDSITKRKKSAGKRIPLDKLLKEEGIAL